MALRPAPLSSTTLVTDPVGQAVHPHAAEVAIGIKPRRHGPKHLAPVLPEPLQAGGKGGVRVKGPSGSLASVNGEANTLQGPNHSIQGTLPNSGGHNHNDIIKVGEHAAGRGESDQAALDVLEGGGETDSKQGRRQRATLVNAPRGMNRRSRAPLPPVKVGGALAQPSHDRRHQTRSPQPAAGQHPG